MIRYTERTELFATYIQTDHQDCINYKVSVWKPSQIYHHQLYQKQLKTLMNT